MLKNPNSNNRYLTTHSLLNSWEYLHKLDNDEYYDAALKSFNDTLRRVKTEPTQAMLKRAGI